MTNGIEMLAIGVIVAVVLGGTYALSNYFSRRRVESTFTEPEEILTAANIYVKYGRTQSAIDLLEHGLEINPSHAELQAKLAELTKNS
ncbi:MAG: tetratricopeptide repeat protein [Proteobacteria bacterium]|nr:tetratricopeptide repeat protein [Pseudomonadota bacterium]